VTTTHDATVVDSTPEIEPELTAALGPFATPIIARHLSDDIIDRLVTAIALGVYVPGQQFPIERDLAAMLGVSRSSIRSALSHLTESGYLEVKRGRNGGYFVLSNWGPASAEHVRRHLIPNWAEFEVLFDARTLIEPMIAKAAAERRTPDDLAAIRGALASYLEAPDHDASRRADSELHHAIAEATHNSILVDLSVDLRTRISLNLGAEPYTDEVRRMAILQHQSLVDAIEKRDGSQAAEIAATHFTLSEDLIRALVDRAEKDDRADPLSSTEPGEKAS
jgi:GntR family transcriptional repressor for pyruvate dehydrogenase complex